MARSARSASGCAELLYIGGTLSHYPEAGLLHRRYNSSASRLTAGSRNTMEGRIYGRQKVSSRK
jgi:hypothetical protein